MLQRKFPEPLLMLQAIVVLIIYVVALVANILADFKIVLSPNRCKHPYIHSLQIVIINILQAAILCPAVATACAS